MEISLTSIILCISSFLLLPQDSTAGLRNLGTVSLKGGLSFGLKSKGKGENKAPLIKHHYGGNNGGGPSSHSGGLVATCCKGKLKLFGQNLFGFGAIKGEYIKDKPSYSSNSFKQKQKKYPSGGWTQGGGGGSNEIFEYSYKFPQKEKFPIKLYKPVSPYHHQHEGGHEEEYLSYNKLKGKYSQFGQTPAQSYEGPGPFITDGGNNNKGPSSHHYEHSEFGAGDYHGEEEHHGNKYQGGSPPPHISEGYPSKDSFPPSSSSHDAYPYHNNHLSHNEDDNHNNGPSSSSSPYNDAPPPHYHNNDHDSGSSYPTSPPPTKEGYNSYNSPNRIPPFFGGPPPQSSSSDKESYPQSKYSSINKGPRTQKSIIPGTPPPFHRGGGEYSDHGPNNLQVVDHHHHVPQDYNNNYYSDGEEQETKYSIYPPPPPISTYTNNNKSPPAFKPIPVIPPERRPFSRRMTTQSDWMPVAGSRSTATIKNFPKLPQGLTKDFKYRVYEYGENEMIVIDGGLEGHEKDLVRAHVYSKNGGKLLRTIEIKGAGNAGKEILAIASDRSDTVVEEEGGDDKPLALITTPIKSTTLSVPSSSTSAATATTPVPLSSS